ncbi:MAG: hypothetical protein JWM85_512, partial [Acidimicrobiaceae bacterium]|nr:hypothetical protein [Acidimicrobiaceae bacterium]
VTLARLGARVAFVGVVGPDAAGRAVREELASEGVDVSALLEVAGLATPESVVVVSADGGRAIYTTGTAARIGPEALAALADDAAPLCARARWVHLDHVGYALRGLLDTGSARISVDGGNPLEGSISGVDLYVPTESGILSRYPDHDLDEAVSEAHREGARAVVVTAGADGSLVSDGRGGRVWVGARPVDVVSTLGAGDVFHGALLAGLLGRDDLVAAVELASAVAARSCSALDGRSGLPSRGEMGRPRENEPAGRPGPGASQAGAEAPAPAPSAAAPPATRVLDEAPTVPGPVVSRETPVVSQDPPDVGRDKGARTMEHLRTGAPPAGLSALVRPGGGFAMLAMDQRESLRTYLEQARRAPVGDEEVVAFKRAALEDLGPASSGVLLDRDFGLPALAAAGRRTLGGGLVLAADQLVQRPGGPVEATSLDPMVDEPLISSTGAVALKLLVIWRAGEEERRARGKLIASFLDRCEELAVASLLEAVLDEEGRLAARAGASAEPWWAMARECADYRPAIYKTELPAGPEVSEDEVIWRCQVITEALACPWVLLSSGVEPDAFAGAVRAACDGGASGFLAGRAVWRASLGEGGYEGGRGSAARARLEELGAIVDERARPALTARRGL